MRMGFALALLAIFLPQNLMVVTHDFGLNWAFLGYFAKEVVIGFGLGFLATVPFVIAQMAGSLIDFQRGASSLQVTDPTTQSQTGPVGVLFNFVLIALFFSLDGPFVYLNAVADSYKLIPVDGVINAAIINSQNALWTQIFGLAGMMMRICTQLAAPALIGILLTDLFLGIANRLAPQVQIVFLGIALKSWVGLALMTAAWSLMLQTMGKEAMTWFQTLSWLVHQVGLAFVR